MNIQEIMNIVFTRDASDLHLVVGAQPKIRVDGKLSQIENEPILVPEVAQQLVYSILSDRQRELLIANKEVDFSFILLFPMIEERSYAIADSQPAGCVIDQREGLECVDIGNWTRIRFSPRPAEVPQIGCNGTTPAIFFDQFY